MQDRFKMRAWDECNKIMHYDFQFIKSGDNGNDWIIFQSDKQELDFDNFDTFDRKNQQNVSKNLRNNNPSQ